MENNLIKLRALEPNDIDFIYENENNLDLWELSNTVSPFSKHILKEYIKTSALDIFTTKQLRLVIESKENNNAVGLIDLFDYDPINLKAGIGIVIIENQRGKHYAESSIELIKDYSFNILKLNQLYCNISEDNEKSLKLFQKTGFEITGKKLSWINSETGFKDVFFLQVINK